MSFFDTVYFEVFYDSLISSFLFTFGEELALPLVFYYKNSDLNFALICAFFGSIAGLMATYAICFFTAKKFAKFFDNYNYRTFAHYYDKFIPAFSLVLLMGQINILMPFFAGFLKTKWLKVLVLLCIYRAIYYAYFLYNYENILKMM